MLASIIAGPFSLENTCAQDRGQILLAEPSSPSIWMMLKSNPSLALALFRVPRGCFLLQMCKVYCWGIIVHAKLSMHGSCKSLFYFIIFYFFTPSIWVVALPWLYTKNSERCFKLMASRICKDLIIWNSF